MALTPQEFAKKWSAALSERASYQHHFLDLCAMLGPPAPAEADPTGSFYAFEKGVEKTGGKGFADYCGARGASSSGRQDAKRAGAPKDPDPLYLCGFRPVARPVLSSV
jgi:hypothetical protein